MVSLHSNEILTKTNVIPDGTLQIKLSNIKVKKGPALRLSSQCQLTCTHLLLRDWHICLFLLFLLSLGCLPVLLEGHPFQTGLLQTPWHLLSAFTSPETALPRSC